MAQRTESTAVLHRMAQRLALLEGVPARDLLDDAIKLEDADPSPPVDPYSAKVGTFEVSASSFRMATKLAALEGISVAQLVESALRRELEARRPPVRYGAANNGSPVFQFREECQNLSCEEIRSLAYDRREL